MQKKAENLVRTRFSKHIFSNFTAIVFFSFFSSEEEVTLLTLKKRDYTSNFHYQKNIIKYIVIY